MADAREGLSVQLEAFAANTMEYLKQERALLLDGVGVPDVAHPDRRPALPDRGPRLRLQGRPARRCGPTSASTSRCSSASTAAPTRCVEAGYTPDMIIGDMDSVSDDALRCGAEVVVHAYADGRAPGLAPGAASSASTAITFPAAATSEDIAMLLADEKGAR